MKQIIALDIDGTLYNDQKEITPKTKEALIEAQKRGHTIVLASGRPTSGLLSIAEQLDMSKYHGILLSYNGGVVIDYTTNQKLYENAIDPMMSKAVIRHVQQFPINPIVDDGYFVFTEDAQSFMIPYESQSNHLSIRVVDDIAEAVNFAPAKILLAAPEETLTQYIDQIKAPFEDKLSFILSAPFYLEVTPIGVNKADSMQIICDTLQISKEYLVAFGDAQNDISMIQFAGTGIAMGNACDALKDCCNIITKSNNEDGIAVALNYLGLIGDHN